MPSDLVLQGLPEAEAGPLIFPLFVQCELEYPVLMHLNDRPFPSWQVTMQTGLKAQIPYFGFSSWTPCWQPSSLWAPSGW